MSFNVGDVISVTYKAGGYDVKDYITPIIKKGEMDYWYFLAPTPEQGNGHWSGIGSQWSLPPKFFTLVSKKPFEVGDKVVIIGQMKSYNANHGDDLPNTNGCIGTITTVSPIQGIRVNILEHPNHTNPDPNIGWWYFPKAIAYTDDNVPVPPKKWKCINKTGETAC